MNKQRIRTTVIGVLLAAFIGVITGIVLCVGFQFTLFNEASASYLPQPSTSAQLLFAAVIGLIGGLIIGVPVGALIGAFQVDKRSGFIIGNLVSIVVVFPLFSGGANASMSAANGLFALFILLGGQCVGVLTAHFLAKHYHPATPAA